MRKIRSGIFGLNALMDGGINENSTTVVIGASGAGKTTIASQFIRRGLLQGQEGIFVSLDENKEQIIREAVEMGWSDILEYLDEDRLVFIDASGRDFSNFIRRELPSFVQDWKGSNARIAVDPLTPVMWSTKDAYEQRELIGFMLKEARKVGTVLCTLEEHGTAGDLNGPEVVIPMYLADNVIHLRYMVSDGSTSRTLKIVKARSSRHSPVTHPYHILRGIGLVVESGEDRRGATAHLPSRAKSLLTKGGLPRPVAEHMGKALDNLRDEDFGNLKPERLVDLILREFGED